MRYVLVCILILMPLALQAGENLQGAAAPDFTLKDLDGHSIQLSQYRSRVVLLFFMATWVRNCGDILTRMNHFYSLYSAKGLVIFNIDIMESKKRAKAFAIKHAVQYPTLLDSDGKVAKKYEVVGVPITVLIGPDGRIICWDCFSLEKLLERQFR